MFEEEYGSYFNGFGKELSLRVYNLAIGLILFYGFVVNYFMCKYLTSVFAEWNFTLVIIGYFVISICGIIINKKSDNPFISFLGYNMVVVPVGVLLCLALEDENINSIIHAIVVTGAVTFLMLVLSCIYPKVFLSMGRALFVALICVIVAEIVFILLGIITPGLWDAAIALLFALYIGYDWAKAQQERHTLDNAVDACVDLYLDIINLFLRVLSSSSKSRRR